MKARFILLVIMSLQLILINSCKKENLFEQPQVTVTGFSLRELPGEMTYLDIELQVQNNDSREAEIADIEYQVTIEGVVSETENEDINQVLTTTEALNLTLPLSLKTSDAIKLLAMLDAGEELDYQVSGTFHVDDPIIKLIDLPLDIEGSAYVEAGFEEFYEQPDVTVDSIEAGYQDAGSEYIFDFNVSCTVQNMDPRSVSVDEVEYRVTIEGHESATHLYSDSYSASISLDGNGSAKLTLPVSLSLSEAEGEALALAIADGSVEYTVEGTFHVEQLEGTAADFYLPLYLEGSVSSSILSSMFRQPDVEVTGYTLLELPGDSTHLDLTLLVTNNDSREALITDITYVVEIEGLVSSEENVDINKRMLPGTPLELTLPLDLLTNDAIELLTRLDAGESLAYHVTGTFHVDEPVVNLFDLPIDISGTAIVDAGFEDFYEQPEITVNSISSTYKINGFTSYTFNLDVACSVHNVDIRAATIDEVEYVVYVEGNKSNTHYYSTTYSENLEMAGDETKDLNLPVTLNLSITNGAALVLALADGSADYIIEGTFHVILVDGSTADFKLPLYDSGTVPVSVVQL